MTNKASVVFMGTPDFAVPTLRSIHENRFDLKLVVTQPDRPRGRGRKTMPPPVKIAGLDIGCDVIQPDHMTDPDVLRTIEMLAPDFFVVVAYGHLLSHTLLSVPRVAAINLHASLLPKYRGAAPIQWAIINGETETGISTMMMDTGMDTGDILLTEKTSITPEDTSQSLHDRLSNMGGPLVVRTIQGLVEDKISPTPQDTMNATYAPMLKKKDGHIDWSCSALEISCLARGVTPWPGAYTFHGEHRLKILKVKPLRRETSDPPGTVLETFPGELLVSTGEGALEIIEIQGPSGKRLPSEDFLRGYSLVPGDRLK